MTEFSCASQQGDGEAAAGVPPLRPHGLRRRDGLGAGGGRLRQRLLAVGPGARALLRVRQQGPPVLRPAARYHVQVVLVPKLQGWPQTV